MKEKLKCKKIVIGPLVPLEQIQMPEKIDQGHYFLMKDFTKVNKKEGTIEIRYIYRGENTEPCYGRMQINYKRGEIRKYSSSHIEHLETANMGEWRAPVLEGAERDIMNFMREKDEV